MVETEAQRADRWRREREIDEVAIGLGLAYQEARHGICYWHAHAKEAFRKGYEAGVTKPRSSYEQIATAATLALPSAHPWAAYLEARRNAIHHFAADGQSFAEIAALLNLADGAHAKRIYDATKGG